MDGRKGSGASQGLVRSRGLRFSLSVLLLAALAPAVGIAAFVAHGVRERGKERAEDHALAVARSVARAYEREFEEVEGLLTGLAAVPAVRELDGAACGELFARILPHTSLINLGAIRPDGAVFCSAVPFAGPVHAGDRDYFRRALETRTFSVGSFARGRIVERDQLGIGFPVSGPGGEVVAVLFAALDAEAGASVLEALALPRGSKVLLVDQVGVVQGAFPPTARQWRGRQVPWRESWQRLAASGGGVEEAAGHDGTSRLMAYAKLGPPLDASRLAVVVRIPSAFVGRAAWRTLAATLLVLLVSASVSLAAIWYFGGVRIGRRLSALAEATRRLAGGDLSVRTGVAHEADEIGSLARSFDAMAERLEHDARERKGLEDSLRQAHKLEAVGRLAGGIAHDFNNLLTAILSYGRFLREELPRDDPRQEDVGEILKAGERAAALTKQLLAFSRRQKTEPRVIGLGPLVAGTEKLLRRLIGEDIELHVAVPDGLPPVRVDPHQLEQVIVNLVVNARDALPGGGRIVVEAGRGRRPQDGGAEREGVILAVRDDGVGMSAEVRTHLFEPFFTTKEVGKGTGLGLATVFGIVRDAGGLVEVESEPGRGSTFRVWLPAAEDVDEEVAPEAAPVGRRGVGETVLLVEDDDAVRALARRVLVAQGYRVLAASRPSEALALARNEAGALALLISDVVMPETSGPALARTLAAERPGLRVLLITGHAGRSGDSTAGAEVLEKPFTPEALAARVRELLAAG